jgi:hypothetical protein
VRIRPANALVRGQERGSGARHGSRPSRLNCLSPKTLKRIARDLNDPALHLPTGREIGGAPHRQGTEVIAPQNAPSDSGTPAIGAPDSEDKKANRWIADKRREACAATGFMPSG